MSKAFQSIKTGLEESIQFVKGRTAGTVIHQFGSADVKNIRTKLGMSQPEFAATFGISVSTLRHWERGDRKPHGPAQVLLNVVAKEPKAVLRALAQ